MVAKQVLYKHDWHSGYPDKVYDYVEKYLTDHPNVSLDVLQHDIRYFKGYLVPQGTLSTWKHEMRLHGRIPRGRATKD